MGAVTLCTILAILESGICSDSSEWNNCKVDEDCTLGYGICLRTEAINKKYLNQYEAKMAPMRAAAMCDTWGPIPSKLVIPIAKCINSKCTVKDIPFKQEPGATPTTPRIK